MSKDLSLSELQLDVMEALWAEDEATTARVHEALGPKRRLAHTTVATLLTRLESRGLVRSRKEGRERIYRATVDRAEVRRSMVDELIGKLFRGDPGALVAHLVEEDELDEAEIARVRDMLDADARRRD